MGGRRADVELVERGLFPSRERARAAILAGEVKADGSPVLKAGQPLSPDASVEVAEGPKYVSRGGHKIEGALDAFGLDVTGMRVLDVGASTGGFTDCAFSSAVPPRWWHLMSGTVNWHGRFGMTPV